jgi:hypothetical protein
MSRVEYSSNNSGGGWWLSDDDWKNLEAAGWEVEWVKDQPDGIMHREGEERWLGALATRAYRVGLSLNMAIAEFEDITGQSADDEGCECCGQPHNFYEVDDEGHLV